MAASQCDVIDFSALERELMSELESDRRHQRENATKVRALEERVASYGEFRERVLASHLRPLERNHREGAPRKQPWNTFATNNK